MLAAIVDGLSWVLLVAGSALMVAGSLGLLRFPDFFTRMHAAGVTDTGGAGLVIAGLMLQAGISLATIKLVAILFFLLLTSPTSTHALAQAALTAGLVPRLGSGRRNGSAR